MDKDELVHDMDAVSPRSQQDNLPVSQQRILKFELQLYKLKDGQYLLDVQVSTALCMALKCMPISKCMQVQAFKCVIDSLIFYLMSFVFPVLWSVAIETCCQTSAASMQCNGMSHLQGTSEFGLAIVTLPCHNDRMSDNICVICIIPSFQLLTRSVY